MNSMKNQRGRGESGGSKSKSGGMMGKTNMPRSGQKDDGLSKKDATEMAEPERYPKDEL